MDTFLSKTKGLLIVKYYGFNDYFGRFFLKNILENLDGIEKHKEEISGPITSLETLYNHLWILAFKSLVNEINAYQIEEEYKIRLLKLADYFEFDKSGFVKLINSSYEQVFDRANHNKLLWHNFFEAVAKLCFNSYTNGLSVEFIEYFEKKFYLYILSDFKTYSSFYNKRIERVYEMFCGLETTRIFDDLIYKKFLENYQNKKDKFFTEKAKFICERSLKHFLSLNLTSDSDKIIQIQSLVIEYQRLAIAYSLVCSNQFKMFSKTVAALLNEYIKKYGIQYRSEKIDLKPAIDSLKSQTSEYKFLSLTLSRDGEKITNCLDEIFKHTNKANPLSEFMNDLSRNRSDKYPYYKQDRMSIDLWVRALLVNAVLNDASLMQEFANYVYNVSVQIGEIYFSNLINIEKETTGIVDSIVNLINLAKNNQFDTPYGKSVTVGITYQICACIEKILRKVAYKEAAGKNILMTQLVFTTF